MSTRIHNGYRFTTTDMAAILSGIDRLRAHVHTATLEMTARLLARGCTDALDAAALGRAPAPSNLLSQEAGEMRARRRRIVETGYRDPEIDFDCEVALMLDEGTWYGILYAEPRDFHDAFCALLPVEAFPYWDGTDGPADMTDADWRARGATWDRILDRRSPAERGLTAQCTRLYCDPRAEDVARFQMDRAGRAARIARSDLLDAPFKAAFAAGTPVPQSEITATCLARADWFQGEQGQAEHAALSAKIAADLPEHYTPSDLLAWPTADAASRS